MGSSASGRSRPSSGITLPRHSSRSSPPRISRSRLAGTATSAVERSWPSPKRPATNIGYLVLERTESNNLYRLPHGYRLPCRDSPRHRGGGLRGNPWPSRRFGSDDHLRGDSCPQRFGGMVGTPQSRESITAARSIVTQLHPDGLRIRHRSAAPPSWTSSRNRQTDPAYYGNDNRRRPILC